MAEDGEKKRDRVQFAFWLTAELGQRFRVLCEVKKVFQREAAEEAIERWCEAQEKAED